MLTLKERFGEVAGRKMVLTWTWHPKPLNTAVANSALLIATKFGMDVTLLCPEPAYLLDRTVHARQPRPMPRPAVAVLTGQSRH